MSDQWWESATPVANTSDDWWEEAKPASRASGKRSKAPTAGPMIPTGEAYDGDTFRLRDGRNVRLFGYDAFERKQQGRASDGSLIPLGEQARSALLPSLPGATVTTAGPPSYGRPVASLNQAGADPAISLLQDGRGLAAPEYLGDSPLLPGYMEAERFARQNRRGAFGTTFATPKADRQGNGEPWKQAEVGDATNGEAVFFDDPTPMQGLRPEIAAQLERLWADPTVSAARLNAYAKAKGFALDPRSIEARAKRGGGGKTEYSRAPRVLTDVGDGRLGATLRGFADPINLLDEAGAVVDTLTGQGGRESVWNSSRRFGDILANNLDQNRSILANDDGNYPWYRFGGQMASGLVVPGASVEGVGLRAASGVMRAGGGRFAARMAAKQAVTRRLGTAGAIEGGLAGAGAGETWQERGIGAGVGTIAGGTLGVGAGVLAPKIGEIVGRPFNRLVGRDGESAADDFAAGAVDTAKASASDDAIAAPSQAGTVAAREGEVPDALLGKPPAEADARPIDFSSEKLNNGARKAIRERRGLSPTEGTFGPILYKLADKWPEALRTMRERGTGEVPGAIRHPELGAIDLIWGDGKFGVSKIEQLHPEVIDHLPNIVSRLPVVETPVTTGNGKFVLSDSNHRAVVAPDYEGKTKRWLVTAYERKGAPGDQVSRRDPLAPAGGSASDGAMPDIVAGDRRGNATMDAEIAQPTLYGPETVTTGDVRRILDDAPNAERRAAAERLSASDVLPLPANTVDGIDEAMAIDAGRIAPVRAPDEMQALESRTIPSPVDGTRTMQKRGPLDLVTWLRTQGGIKAQGGELEHAGIDNAPRKGLDFAGGEGRFGKLVSNDGMTYDEAALRAWEAGYFPDHADRPTPAEFLDALTQTHNGNARRFRLYDEGEIADFLAARDQRWAVEAAREEGAPLSIDRGQPVDMADLDANSAPVQAYEEWGENAPNLVGNIRLDKLNSPQAIKRALVQTERVTGGFDAARRGRITHAETERLAADLGMTVKDLLARRKGEAFNAEQALAARQILARSATDLVNMAKRVARLDDPGQEAEAAFREAWLRHAAIQEQVAGMTAEAGRLLQQFRQAADAKAVGRVLPSLNDLPGGSARIKDVADQIVELEKVGVGPGGINRFAVKSLRARTKDMAIEYYINSLLSGPQTHVVNMVSNTLTALAQIPEHAVAAGVGAVRRGGERMASAVIGRNVGNADRVLFSEAGGRFVGLLQGTRDGLREAGRALRTGDTSDAVSKVENQAMRAIPGRAGEIIRIPTRLLSAEDELFKGMARRMELTGIAMRMANAEGLRGNAAKARVADLIANPTDKMQSAAHDYARYLTFQSPLGPVMRNVSAMANSSPAIKFLIPFVRTPTNLLTFAIERSPAAPILKEWRREVAAGGARRDVAVARALVGTGIGAMFYEAALAGNITGGGPADEEAKRLMMADGWQPYSVRVGDTYYSYRRLDPFATTIGTVADMVDLGSHMTDKQREKSTMLVTAAILNNLSSKTWLTGISGISDALSDPERNWQDFVSGSLSSIAVPALVSQIARTADPILREARTPIDRIRSRVPGLSDDLFPRRDAFGAPIRSEGGLGPDIATPIWIGTAKNDPTIAALLDAGAHVTAPRRVLGKRELTPAEYDRYSAAVGSIAKPRLDDLVWSDGWRAADDEGRQELVRKLMTAARKEARTVLD